MELNFLFTSSYKKLESAIDHFYYNTNKTCANHLLCAIVILFLHDFYRPNTNTAIKIFDQY